MPVGCIRTSIWSHRETANRGSRRLARFLALSLAVHLCLLAGFRPSSVIVAKRYLGQPVLDVQLQDRALPLAASPKSAVRPRSTARTSDRHAVTPPVETTTSHSFPSVSIAVASGAAREPMPAAETEAGLRNQLLGEMQTRLSHYLTYPPLARQRGWEGTVLLGLRVESDGHLEKIRIVRSSGYAVLDHSALNSLTRLGRLTGVSAWLHGRGMDMQLPVIYQLVED